MSLIDKLLGAEQIIRKAQTLYESGDYHHSLNLLDEISALKWGLCSRQAYLEQMYLSAKCFHKLGEKESAIKMLDIIINYPDYNHNYISKAEAFRKQILDG